MAVFSPDEKYRYFLRRDANPMTGNGAVTFLLLNPSTATLTVDDPTIRRCLGFCRAWGYRWMQVVNLSPLRATDPQVMLEAGPELPEVQEENLGWILEAAQISDLVIVAYGVHGVAEDRGRKVLEALADAGIEAKCLGLTAQGYPRHPLYVRKDVDLLPYPWH